MADILIRGIEMSKNCMVCDFRNRGFDLNGDLFCNCRITKENVPDYYNIRMENCPLIELPEHGDLIDRDALIKTCNEIIDEDWNAKAAPYSWSYAYESFVDDIVAIPVIIPSNKEETE